MSKYQEPKNIKNITVIGGGIIGSSWAALFSAYGKNVKISEPCSDTRNTLLERIKKAQKSIKILNNVNLKNKGKIIICKSLNEAIHKTDFVQESAPDKSEIKKHIFEDLDLNLHRNIPVASSTSSLLITPLQKYCKTAERFFTGHPYNPPSLMPLVEISGGEKTDELLLEWASSFYSLLGKYPVKLNKEIIGHIAGRLSAALWQEAVHLVSEGIADVESVDAAMVNGPGLRSAAMGPHLTYHLAGGQGGMQYYISHLGKSQEKRWSSLGKPKLDQTTSNMIVNGIKEAAKNRPIKNLEEERDLAIINILKSKQVSNKTKK